MGIRMTSKNAAAIAAAGLSLALAACRPAQTAAQKAGPAAETWAQRIRAAWRGFREENRDEIDALQRVGRDAAQEVVKNEVASYLSSSPED